MSSWADPDALMWLVATIAALVLMVTVLAAWARERPALRGSVIAGCACVLLGGSLVLLLLAPTDIATGWITVLQEGRSARNVRQLYGLAAHAGPGFGHLVDRVSGHGPTTLPALVRMHVCLAVVNAIVLGFLARRVLRSWWGSLAFVAAYTCNLNTINAAFSETPAMVWTTHVWLACIAAAIVSDRDASRRLRWLALASLALLTVLAAWIRTEALVIGLPALAIGLAHVVGAEEGAQRMVGAAGQQLRTILTGPLSVFLLVSGGLLALEYVPMPDDWRYAIVSIRPLNFSFLTWLQAITLFYPFAIVVLSVLGMIHAVRQWFAFFLLPISVLLLLNFYASVSHGPFLDKFRYLTFVTPFVLLLALFGFRELSMWAARLSWPAWWKRMAVLLLIATVPAWNPWQREFFERRQQLPGVSTPEAFLARNEQTEVRYLLDLVARYPRCVFLAKTPRAESATAPTTGYRWLAFGAPVRMLAEKEDASGADRMDRMVAELAPDAPCVLFYRSLDCDLVGFDGCDAETKGRTPLEQRVLENLPYSEIYEYGAHRAEIRLAVYPVAVRDRSALASAADAFR
jgi:hypothetical protein